MLAGMILGSYAVAEAGERFGFEIAFFRAVGTYRLGIFGNFLHQLLSVAIWVGKKLFAERGRHFDVDGVFVAIGYDPVVPKVEDIYLPMSNGYIITTAYCEAGNDRIYAIGDVATKPYRQVASAVNDGMTAALSIIKKM